MYKRTGPVNKETQDDVARRSNPSCFRAQEEFRVRLEAAGAQINTVSVGTTLQPRGLDACDRASLVTSKLTHNRQVQACKKRRIPRPTSEMWF
jgi:hypothetical protein